MRTTVRTIGLALALGLIPAAGCEKARDEATEDVVERALRRDGRDAEVEIDRESKTISIRLGEKSRDGEDPKQPKK